jgi:hypothetical protein
LAKGKKPLPREKKKARRTPAQKVGDRKRAEAVRRAAKEKREFHDEVEALVFLRHRREGFGENWTIGQIRNYKERQRAFEYTDWRVKRGLMEEKDESWMKFRRFMRKLGMHESDIRAEWFSPMMLG